MSKFSYSKHSNTRANKAIEQSDNSDPKIFAFSYNVLALVAKKLLIDFERPNKIWYLDSGASWYIYKNKAIFKDFWHKSIKFSITSKKIIYLQKISIIIISLSNDQSIKLLNIVLVLECKSNLIFFGQLQETSFTYYDKSIKMTLIKRAKVVAYTR